MFNGFREVIEIDPIVILGCDLSSVYAAVLLSKPRDAPCDIWLSGGAWGSHTIRVNILHMRSREGSYNAMGEYNSFFGPQPPPLFQHNMPPLPDLPFGRSPRGGGKAPESSEAGAGRALGRMLSVWSVPFSSVPYLPLAPPPTLATDDITYVRQCGMVISKIVDESLTHPSPSVAAP